MKRVLLSLIVALVATLAMAQDNGSGKSEAWKSKYDEISKRIEGIDSQYEKIIKANGSKEEIEAVLKSFSFLARTNQ